MLIGKLSRLVTIQKLVVGQDAIGQPTQVWSTLATVWADIRYLNGIEMVKSDAPVSVVKSSIRIRRRADVTAGMRVALGTTYFNILAVLPDDQSRERLDLACEVVS